MKYLLDTNVLIAMFRNHHGIREQILKAGIANCYISELTIAELKVGAYKTGSSRQWREVHETERSFNILPVSSDDLDLYAHNRAILESQGNKIDQIDLIIGSSAIQNDMVLVTHNNKHFERIPHIHLEDWETY